MLPAELMGLNSSSFKHLNNLIKNKKFINALVSNVSSILYFSKKKKFNSIIINYDEKSENLFIFNPISWAGSIPTSDKTEYLPPI